MNRAMHILMGAMLMAIGLTAAAAEPTGASLAWTSSDPVVARARDLVEKGDFARAEAALELAADDVPARGEMLEIIARLRREYSLDAEGLVAKLKPTMADVTLTEVEKWRASGEIQWRQIDGKAAIFRREPANLFRFCGEAKQRRGPQAEEATGGWTLAKHLGQVIAEAERSGREHVLPIKHRVTFTLTVPAAELKAGSVVRVWLAYPQEHRRQSGVRLISASPEGAIVAPAGTPQRSIYFERRVAEAKEAVVCRAAYEFTSEAYYPKLADDRARDLPADYAGGNLGERPPHIVFTAAMKKAVGEAVGAERNPLARARGIYRWVCQNVAYHAEEEYGVIPSLSVRALAKRRGDCGMQSMLFITMCRCAGIPARWQSGWETKPAGWDMHDWAEFYVEPWGWLPADPSYGLQKGDDPRVREFYFGHQDSYRLIVNSDYGTELVPRKASLRSEPADFQRGEVEVDGRNLYFDKWDYEVGMEWE